MSEKDPDRSNGPPTELSKADQRHLETLEGKLQLVRDYTTSVATGRTGGFYLHGNGGCGKSFTVIKELERLQIPYKLYNSRMTGRGLYNALEKSPDSVHLLEDMEQLFRESGARGVLRSALWSQGDREDDGPSERLITWTTHVREHQFVFTGGLIMTANRPFPDVPELDAVKTRIAYMHLSVSDNEIIAMMRNLSLRGVRKGSEVLEPQECLQVCDFIIQECLGLNRLLDLRLFTNGLSDFLQFRECQSGCHWHDLVSTRIKERPTKIREAKPISFRNDQKRDELQLAQELSKIDDREERYGIWHEQTGKSEQTLYRRLKQVEESGFSDSHAEN
jgi:hypothetical protein